MKISLDKLILESMASGHQSLFLTERISWESFPDYAAAFVELLGASVESKVDGPDVRLWVISVEGACYWLTFDNFLRGVSLDSQDETASEKLPSIREKLLSIVGDEK